MKTESLIFHASRLASALQDLLDWGREHTSPRDPDSPHALLVKAVEVLEAYRSGKP